MSWLRRGMFCCLLLLAAAPFWAAWAQPLRPPGGDSADVQAGAFQAAATSTATSTGVDEQFRTMEAPAEFLVRVTGRDFRWHFEVMNDPEAFSGTIRKPSKSRLGASVLELPTGVPIRWEVSSEDYVYWLRVPELNINVIAVPDLTFEAVSHPTDAMAIDLLVDPLCGFRFYHDEWMGRIQLEDSIQGQPENQSQQENQSPPEIQRQD